MVVCLEEGQLPRPLLLLSPVVQPEHCLVHHAGEEADLVDLLFGRDAAELVVECDGDLCLEESSLLLFVGCHSKIIVSKLNGIVKIWNVDKETGFKTDRRAVTVGRAGARAPVL